MGKKDLEMGRPFDSWKEEGYRSFAFPHHFPEDRPRPTILRSMTEEETSDEPDALGRWNETTRRLSWNPKLYSNLERLGHVIGHELGHRKYPVDKGKPYSRMKNEEYHPWYLFSELCADYAVLVANPRDERAEKSIRYNKKKAWAEGGLTPAMVGRIDKIARKRVGYTGREVKRYANE